MPVCPFPDFPTALWMCGALAFCSPHLESLLYNGFRFNQLYKSPVRSSSQIWAKPRTSLLPNPSVYRQTENKGLIGFVSQSALIPHRRAGLSVAPNGLPAEVRRNGAKA
jgi:hypothetical protein